ncbi:uncharacterized protein [Eurosta solidaginis]
MGRLPVFKCHDGYLGGSHHKPIVIEMMNSKQPNHFVARKKLQDNLNTVDFIYLEDFERKLRHARKKATIDLNNTGYSPKAWWDKELEKHYRVLTAKRKKARQTGNVVDFEAAVIESEKWKKAVKEAKRKNYLEKIEEINTNPNAKEAWRFVNNVHNMNHGEKNLWADEDNANYLKELEQQVKQSSSNISEQDMVSGQQLREEICFSFEKFLELLNKKKFTAGGLDRITFDMLKELSIKTKGGLFYALVEHFKNNTVKAEWREIKIIPIPKAGKDLDDFRHYRPISLLSVVVKSLNMMIKDKLTEFIENKKVIPNRSFAYRENRSATMCLNEALHYIAEVKSKKKTKCSYAS